MKIGKTFGIIVAVASFIGLSVVVTYLAYQERREMEAALVEKLGDTMMTAINGMTPEEVKGVSDSPDSVKLRGKFIYYNVDSHRFDGNRNGAKHYANRADDITHIIFFTQGRDTVGYYSYNGQGTIPAIKEYVKLVVLDVNLKALVASKTFGGDLPNQLSGDDESLHKNYATADITTGRVQEYVDGLFEK